MLCISGHDPYGGNRMLKRKGRVLAAIVTAAAGGWLAAGCSVHVSVGETPAVSRHTVETQIATTLARQENQPVPKVVCPGDLKGKVGTVMYCSLTAQGSTTSLPREGAGELRSAEPRLISTSRSAGRQATSPDQAEGPPRRLGGPPVAGDFSDLVLDGFFGNMNPAQVAVACDVHAHERVEGMLVDAVVAMTHHGVVDIP